MLKISWLGDTYSCVVSKLMNCPEGGKEHMCLICLATIADFFEI